MTSHDRLEEINAETVQTLLPAIIIIIILMFIGIIGNPLVIYFYAIKLKPTASYIFITTLAAFDLTCCVISMPLEIVDLLHFFTFESSDACRALRFINYIAHIASGATLIAIAVDRFRKLCKPFEKQISNRSARIIVGIVILFAIFSSWPSLVFNRVESVNITISGETFVGHDCSSVREGSYVLYLQIYNAYLFFLFLCAIVILLVLYILVGRQLRALRSFRFYSTGSTITRSRPISTTTIVSEVQSISGANVFEVAASKPTLEENDDDKNDAAIVEAFEAELRQGNLTTIEEDEDDEEFEDDDSDKFIQNSCRTSTTSLKVSKIFSNKVSPAVGEIAEIKDIPIVKPIRLCSSFTASSRQIRLLHGPRRTKSEISVTSPSRQLGQTHVHPASGIGSKSCHEISSVHNVATRLSRCASVDIDESKMSAQNVNIKKFTMITVCISIAFILSFLPYLILATLSTLSTEHEANYLSKSELVVCQIFVRSFLFNSVCNPFIYGLLNTEFKKMFLSGLKKICCFMCGINTGQNTTTNSVP